jgi:EAL domain-containing protein (putative c-di-GMP-specific phosphodiesterase class I)
MSRSRRWQRPGHGLVPPDDFIPTAEQSNIICDIDRWVLQQATRQFADWIRTDPEGWADVTMAVNISGRHLASSDIVNDVAAALRDAGIPPVRLVLEITETVLVDEPTAAARLSALRELGVAISIDDFGTGYTSIGQLQNLHVDIVKIDRSFIASSAPGTQELVTLMINAGQAFGLHVVAEGVEHRDELTSLRERGCDSAQGYLFARPLPASEIAARRRRPGWDAMATAALAVPARDLATD